MAMPPNKALPRRNGRGARDIGEQQIMGCG